MASATRRVDPAVLEAFKKFKLSNAANAAMILKIDKDDETVILEENFPETTPEDLTEDMSESSPRFLLYSFRYDRGDGRVSYPLVLILFMPSSAPDRARMLYASMSSTVSESLQVAKVLELTKLEDLTHEWLCTNVR